MALSRRHGATELVAFVLALAMTLVLVLLAASQGVGLALAGCGLAALLLASVVSSWAGLVALVLVTTTEALYKGAAPSMLTMLLKDLFLVLLLLHMLFDSQRRRDFDWLHQPLTIPALLFGCYCLAMLFAPSTRSLLLALAGLRAWLLWMPLYYPAYRLFADRRRVYSFAVGLVCLQVPICLYGVVQGNIGYEHTRIIPGFHDLTAFYQAPIDPEADGGRGQRRFAFADPQQSVTFEKGFRPLMAVRACSIYTSPGYFGSMAVLTVFVGLGVMAWATTGRARLLGVLAVLAGGAGLLASGSRAPMVGLVVGLAVVALISHRRGAAWLGLVTLLFCSLYLVRDLSGTGARRIENQLTVAGAVYRSFGPLATGFAHAMEHPFGNGIATGIGAGRIVYSGELELRAGEGSRFIENEFGRALAELGFVGAALWLWMVLTPLTEALRDVRSMGRRREALLAAGLLGLMVSLFVELGVGSALYGAAGIYYYLFAAMIRRLAEAPADAASVFVSKSLSAVVSRG